jgi:hypothetical protein
MIKYPYAAARQACRTHAHPHTWVERAAGINAHSSPQSAIQTSNPRMHDVDEFTDGHETAWLRRDDFDPWAGAWAGFAAAV